MISNPEQQSVENSLLLNVLNLTEGNASLVFCKHGFLVFVSQPEPLYKTWLLFEGMWNKHLNKTQLVGHHSNVFSIKI